MKGCVIVAVYKISDILKALCSASIDGYYYVSISCNDEDNDSLLLSYENDTNSEEEFIDSVSSFYSTLEPENDYDPNDICPLLFSNDEIQDLSDCILNAIHVFKDSPKNKKLDRDTRDKIKKSLVAWRNLDAKFNKFFKHYFE